MAGKGDQGKNVGKPGKPGWQPTDKSKAAGKTPPPSGPIVPADVEPQAAPDIQAAYLNLMNETHLGSSDLTQPPKLAPVDPRDIGAKEAASGHPTGRNMAGRISVAALRIGDTISLPTMPKGNETVTVEKIGVLGARVVVTVRSLDGTTQKTHMATAGSVLLVEAGPVDTPPIPANPGSHVDAPSIQRAAEDAGVYYEDTYDGVTIGDYSITATVNGATVTAWHGRGPEATEELIANYPDAESAISAVLNF